MTPEEFVKILRNSAMNAAVDGTAALLEKPPGRKPTRMLVEASNWYHTLTEEERAMLMRVINMATHQAVFGVLAILDGVRVVDNDLEKGSFHLTFRRGSVEWSLTGTELLHDLFSDNDPAQNP
jgi:hypothetical protein